MKTLDMTGRPCPIPVVEARKALASEDAVEVLVDNAIAVQNLEKMAKGTGCAFSYAQEGDARYRVAIAKRADSNFSTSDLNGKVLDDNLVDCPAPSASAAGEGPTVLITGQGLGRGSDELGAALMKGFVFSLTQLAPIPAAVIFMNGGAHLSAEGAATVDDLRALAAAGCEVLTCGTCANFYGLTEKLAVGAHTDMMDIAKRAAAASRLVTL